MTTDKDTKSEWLVDTPDIFMATQSGLLLSGILFTFIIVSVYRMFFGGGLDLYGGYYRGLGIVVKLFPLGVIIAILTHIGYNLLPKSKRGIRGIWIFLPELVIDVILFYYWVLFVLDISDLPLYRAPLYLCFCPGIVFI